MRPTRECLRAEDVRCRWPRVCHTPEWLRLARVRDGLERGVQDDKIELAPWTRREPIETIGLYRLMAAAGDQGLILIEGPVSFGTGEGVCGNVEVRHGSGATPSRIQ